MRVDAMRMRRVYGCVGLERFIKFGVGGVGEPPSARYAGENGLSTEFIIFNQKLYMNVDTYKS